MSFTALVFLPFLAIVLAVHWLPLSWRFRKFNLLWLSYVFYAAWNPPFVLLLWVSTLVDWNVGKWLGRTESPARRRGLLLLSLFVNLGMLSYFKYGQFIVDNFAALMGAIGIDWAPAELDIALPIGISFYTFQTLSYTIDIYQRRAKPWGNFLDYALFVTFFPQLVAGPIVRAREFLPQCEKPLRVTGKQFAWGMYCFVIGAFQKVVIADGLLAQHVDDVFNGGPPTCIDSWVACTGFAGQIFCDFAGYSICAIGIARCLGFHLPMNFNYPLAAIGFAEFWRRWHISLSTWLRDYVYKPLGGNRVSLGRWIFNLLLTWMLIGLWHGAAWRFVVWGLMSGTFIVLERIARQTVPASPLWSKTGVLFGFACVQFVGFSITLVPFRAVDFQRVVEVGAPMFLGTPEGRPMILSTPAVIVTVVVTILLFLWHWMMRASSLEELADRTPAWLRSLALAFMLMSIVLMHGRDQAFIYFQF